MRERKNQKEREREKDEEKKREREPLACALSSTSMIVCVFLRVSGFNKGCNMIKSNSVSDL